jgi:leucyl aminopeptidase
VDHLIRLEKHINALSETRKVRFEQDGDIIELSEGHKALLTLVGQRFVDVTTDKLGHQTYSIASKASNRYPDKFRHSKKELESSIYKHVDMAETKKFLQEFTGFYTRYYHSPTGKQSQQMLQRTLENVSCSARQDRALERSIKTDFLVIRTAGHY